MVLGEPVSEFPMGYSTERSAAQLMASRPLDFIRKEMSGVIHAIDKPTLASAKSLSPAA